MLLALVRHIQAVGLLQGSLQGDGVQGETEAGTQRVQSGRDRQTRKRQRMERYTQPETERDRDTNRDETDKIHREGPKPTDRQTRTVAERHRERRTEGERERGGRSLRR